MAVSSYSSPHNCAPSRSRVELPVFAIRGAAIVAQNPTEVECVSVIAVAVIRDRIHELLVVVRWHSRSVRPGHMCNTSFLRHRYFFWPERVFEGLDVFSTS